MPAENTVFATLRFDRMVDAPVERVWEAYTDLARRSVWSVPEGEAVEYDDSDFSPGGIDRYRCGPPGDLSNHMVTRYRHIDDGRSFVATNELRRDGAPVAVDTGTWDLVADGDSTRITVVVQVTSLVGDGVLDGYRGGHDTTLDHLASYLVGRRGSG